MTCHLYIHPAQINILAPFPPKVIIRPIQILTGFFYLFARMQAHIHIVLLCITAKWAHIFFLFMCVTSFIFCFSFDVIRYS